MEASLVKQEGKHAFYGNVNDFHIVIDVFDHLLIISLTSEVSYEEFSITIDQEMIDKSKYSMLIENLSELCIFIVDKIKKKQISIGKDGSIQMEINVESLKKSLKVKFDAVPKQMSKEAMAQKKINKLQNQVHQLKCKLQIQQCKFIEQQQKLKEQQRAIIELKENHYFKIERLQKTIQDFAVSQQIKFKEQQQLRIQLQLQLQNLKNQVSSLKLLNEQKNNIYVEQKKAQSQKKNTEDKRIFEQKKRELQKQMSSFSPDKNDTHYPYFNANSKIITKKQDGFYNLIGRRINDYSTNSYKIKILKSFNNNIYFGIGTDALKGMKFAYKSKQSLCYYGYINGYISTGDTYPQQSKGGIGVGDTIEVRTDISNWKVEWFKNGKKLTQWRIPNQMKSKPIYQIIVMYNKDDQIELIE